MFAELPSPRGRFSRLTTFERMGDGRCRRIWRGAREFRARQHCIRINLECDGDQRQRENDGHGSHGGGSSGAIEAKSAKHFGEKRSNSTVKSP
jgi:hypothetical protein